jgi:hypothetical protein
MSMKHGELGRKIRAATGPPAELGAVLVDLMREYFSLCGEALKLRRIPAGASPIAAASRIWDAEHMETRAETIEKVVEKIAGPIEAVLDESNEGMF